MNSLSVSQQTCLKPHKSLSDDDEALAICTGGPSCLSVWYTLFTVRLQLYSGRDHIEISPATRSGGTMSPLSCCCFFLLS